MSEDAWLFFSILVLILLFAGDPDLMDAIINNLMCDPAVREMEK